jgi:hypothetical protein
MRPRVFELHGCRVDVQAVFEVSSRVRRSQSVILNFTPGPKGFNLSPGWGLSSPLCSPLGVNTLLFRRMEGRTENFTPMG